MLSKNQVHTVSVTDLNNLGNGVGRIDQAVVFLDDALPGETVRARIIKVAKDYAVGKVEQILTASPRRIQAKCPVAKQCGGCCYQTLSPEAELTIKRNYVVGAFRKAGLQGAVIDAVIPSPKESHYRNKVLYPVDEQFRIGYYARHSHRIVPCRGCMLQDEAFEPILADLEAFFRHHRPDNLRHLYLRIAKGTGQIMVCPVLKSAHAPWREDLVKLLSDRHPNVVTVLLNINPTDGNVVLGKEFRILSGDGYLEDVLCGLRFRISPHSFYQVNPGAAELLYEEALRRAASTSPKKIADLYCGTGTIGLILSSRIEKSLLKGVEIVPDAVENARFNAALNNIERASFVCADSVGAEISGMDCVILDPPRKGSTPALLTRIAEEKIPNVVYVSCNPDTLARDAALLVSLGYEMGNVTPVDMFPRTGAIESVVSFTLSGKACE